MSLIEEELLREIKEAKDFFTDVQTEGYNIEFEEFKFSKGKRNYETILNKLANIELTNPTMFIVNDVPLDELKQYMLQLMPKIWGDYFTEALREMTTGVVQSGKAKGFDTIIKSSKDGKRYSLEKIYVGRSISLLTATQVACSFSMVLQMSFGADYVNRIIGNYHSKYLLPILTSYIFAYELSILLKDDSLNFKHSLVRCFNDHEHAFALKNIDKAYKNYPFLGEYFEYFEHSSFSFIVGNVYARRLFDFYKDDPKALLNMYRALINGEKTLKEMLSYYGVALKDSETVGNYLTTLDELKLKKS